MKFSNAFIFTEKETPKEAVLPSHIYLLRGGFITQVAAGIYDLMPLGKRVLDNIRNVVTEEMDAAGGKPGLCHAGFLMGRERALFQIRQRAAAF